MSAATTAFEEIRNTYDLDKLREIDDLGCVECKPDNHATFKQTNAFFDKYEKEIIDFVRETYGPEIIEESLSNNEGDLPSYKNDMVFFYIEKAAEKIIKENPHE